MIEFEVAYIQQSFFDSIERILAADYVPTEADIAELPTEGASTVTETKVCSNEGYYNLLSCHKSLSAMRKLEHMIHSMDLVMIIIDLASYDQVYIERGGDCQNKMLQNITLTEFIAKTVKVWTPVVLLLKNRAEFEDKLSKMPLTTAFPEYIGGANPELALEHIVGRLREIKKTGNCYLYIHLTEESSDIASSVLTLVDWVFWLKNLSGLAL